MRAQITHLPKPIIEALRKQLDNGGFAYLPVHTGQTSSWPSGDGIATESIETLLVATKLLDVWGVS